MITPNVLIQHAEFLLKQDSEIEWRDGIKHAYYYVYHLTKKFVSSNRIGIDISHDNIGEHQYLIQRILTIDSKLARALVREIQMLRDKRVTCCYKLDNNVTKIMLFQQIGAAKKAEERLNKLLTNSQ